MRMHFWHWHVRDTVVILKEGNLPPMVIFLQHYGAVAVPELVLPVNSTVQEGGGAEARAVGGRGGKGGHLTGVQLLWSSPWDGDLLHIPGETNIDKGQLLAGGDTEYGEGAGGVEEDDDYP